MADQEKCNGSCLLISIEAPNRELLYDCYRDYLVFMSLIRDGVTTFQYKVFGFCWLKDQCLMLIKPEVPAVGDFLLKILKRYHFWLLQRGPEMTEYKLQMIELNQSSWVLDSLRFIHQNAVKRKEVDDAMDYHWHSYHVYNGFWSVNWLETDFILNQFAQTRLAAMSRFRQYMLHPPSLDFSTLLDDLDCSSKYITESIPQKREVAEVNSPYHQSMFDSTETCLLTVEGKLHVQVRVLSEADGLSDMGRVGSG